MRCLLHTMTIDLSRHIPSIRGELVETYQKDGEEYAKIALKNLHLELPLVLLDDAHLGDHIQLDLEIGVRSARILNSLGPHG